MLESNFILLTRSPLDAPAIERLAADPSAGAVVSFIGVTRNHHLGRGVLGLEYEALESLARKMLEKLRSDAMQRFGLVRAVIHHRLGRVDIGEASVVIAVSAAHRGAAFDGCRFLIDDLKTTVPIWKKEFYADGSAPEWVGPDGKPISIS
ncbi:MAG: molybdenum cofactor biosynthesis protein MoaE [Planctomycetota bacterium]